MRKAFTKTLFISSALALGLSSLVAKPFSIDGTHSSVNFQIKHMLISDVVGAFNEFDGKIDFDIASKKLKALEGEVTVSSIDTKNKKRDEHLNKDDFFYSSKFPKAKIVATKISSNKVTADLTIRGITKPVTFNLDLKGPVENPMSKKQIIALKLEGKIKRKDFEVGLDTPDASLSNEVLIQIKIEATE